MTGGLRSVHLGFTMDRYKVSVFEKPRDCLDLRPFIGALNVYSIDYGLVCARRR